MILKQCPLHKVLIASFFNQSEFANEAFELIDLRSFSHPKHLFSKLIQSIG